jgi:hypothetical protein
VTAQRFAPVKKLAARVFDGKAVMLTVADSKLHRLNESATRVWQGVEVGRSLEEIAAGLAAEFAVAPEEARADVAALLAELERRGIVERLPEGSAEAPG